MQGVKVAIDEVAIGDKIMFREPSSFENRKMKINDVEYYVISVCVCLCLCVSAVCVCVSSRSRARVHAPLEDIQQLVDERCSRQVTRQNF